METWGVIFLGIIALGSVAQIVALAYAISFTRDLSRRVDDLQGRIESDVLPALANLRKATEDVSEMSERAVGQVRRVDASVTETLTRIDEMVRDLRRLMVRPPGPLGDAVALVKAIRRGIEVYQRLSAADDRPDSRRYRDDEHLFI
jgi:hypothetical protein